MSADQREAIEEAAKAWAMAMFSEGIAERGPEREAARRTSTDAYLAFLRLMREVAA